MRRCRAVLNIAAIGLPSLVFLSGLYPLPGVRIEGERVSPMRYPVAMLTVFCFRTRVHDADADADKVPNGSQPKTAPYAADGGISQPQHLVRAGSVWRVSLCVRFIPPCSFYSPEKRLPEPPPQQRTLPTTNDQTNRPPALLPFSFCATTAFLRNWHRSGTLSADWRE